MKLYSQSGLKENKYREEAFKVIKNLNYNSKDLKIVLIRDKSRCSELKQILPKNIEQDFLNLCRDMKTTESISQDLILINLGKKFLRLDLPSFRGSLAREIFLLSLEDQIEFGDIFERGRDTLDKELKELDVEDEIRDNVSYSIMKQILDSLKRIKIDLNLVDGSFGYDLESFYANYLKENRFCEKPDSFNYENSFYELRDSLNFSFKLFSCWLPFKINDRGSKVEKVIRKYYRSSINFLLDSLETLKRLDYKNVDHDKFDDAFVEKSIKLVKRRFNVFVQDIS